MNSIVAWKLKLGNLEEVCLIVAHFHKPQTNFPAFNPRILGKKILYFRGQLSEKYMVFMEP